MILFKKKSSKTWYLVLSVLLCGCAHRDKWESLDGQAEGIMAFTDTQPLSNGVLELDWDRDGSETLLSIDAENMPRFELIQRILEASHLPYRLPSTPISGKCSLRLNRIPIAQALNACLLDIELEAVVDLDKNKMIVIRDRPELANSAPIQSTNQNYITKIFSPHHQSAQKIYENLFKSSDGSLGILSSSVLPAFGAISIETNRLYFRGTPECVDRLYRMARLADQPSSRLRIELYTYTRRPNADLTQTSADTLVNQGKGSFALNLSEDAAGTDLGTIQLGFQDVASAMQKAVLSAVNVRTLGQFLSGTEVLVANGEKFFLNVGKTGYILTTQFFSGTPATQSQSITTGSLLGVTPICLPNDSVHLDLEVDSSKFSNNPPLFGNKTRNYRVITVQVPLNTLIVIQGLTRPNSTRLRNEVSALRKIPILNFFVSNKVDTDDLEQDITFLRVSRAGDSDLSPLAPISADSLFPIADSVHGVSNR